jgi:uncharacterized membrane protein
MSLESKLEAWVAAGLIDADAAARIRAHEEANDRPYVLWAIVGLGLFALALGLALIVAANWDVIADWLKLGAHLALTAAAAVAVWVGAARGNRWLKEGALFLLAVLVLAGIALHSQVYQLTGPMWQALVPWLLLMTPAMLLAGSTRLVAYGWAGMLLGTLASLALENEHAAGLWYFVHGLAIAGPVLLIGLSLLPWRNRLSFADGLREVGVIIWLGGVSFAHFVWAGTVTSTEAGEMAVRLVVPVVVAAAAVWAGRRWRMIPQAMLLPIIAAPMAALLLATVVPHADGWPARLAGALIYMAMWGVIARAAIVSGWRALFGVAIAAVGIRIFIIYFELFGSLATTGAGLIIGGILLIALALGWRRVFALVGRTRA